MSTRCLVYVYADEEMSTALERLMCMYVHHDGYPAGVGMKLAQFLHGLEVGNGALDKDKYANGMGCLAAQIVAHFKDGVGNVYLYAPATVTDVWQEYEYHVHKDKVVVTDPKTVIFIGTWDEFYKFCKDSK